MLYMLVFICCMITVYLQFLYGVSKFLKLANWPCLRTGPAAWHWQQGPHSKFKFTSMSMRFPTATGTPNALFKLRLCIQTVPNAWQFSSSLLAVSANASEPEGLRLAQSSERLAAIPGAWSAANSSTRIPVQPRQSSQCHPVIPRPAWDRGPAC